MLNSDCIIVKVKNIIKRHYFVLFFIISLALILRISLLAWALNFPNNTDFNRYEDWARIAHIYSFADTYTTTHLSVSKLHANNQPPGTLYIVSGTYELYIITGKVITKLKHTMPGSNLWINTTLQHIFLRLPQMIADFGMGFIVYFLVKEKGEKIAIISASLVLFNPTMIYNSTVWGQMDSLNNLFFLLAIFLAFKKRISLSVFSLTISLFIKFSLLPLLPFYFVFLYFVSGKKWKIILISIFIAFSGFVLTTYPISKNPIVWLNREIPLILNGEVNLITNGAFNFWWAITNIPGVYKNAIPAPSQTFLKIMLNSWGYILFILATFPLFYFQIKKSKLLIGKKEVFIVFSIVSFAVFLFLPSMHERYLYPLFPLFAVFVGLIKSKKFFLIAYFIATLLNLGNLVYSWYPAKFPDLLFYQIIYSPFFGWGISVLTIIIFVMIYKKTFSFLLAKN